MGRRSGAGRSGRPGNRGAGPRELTEGVYAVSNAVLDTPWHKVEYAKTAFDTLIRSGIPSDESLLELLADDTRAPIESVQPGRLPIELAHAITAPFIVGSTYGTRSMSIVRMDRRGDISIVERRFGADGRPTGEDRVNYSSS